MSEDTRASQYISVRNLVEFMLRNGDIDEGDGSMDPFEAMQAGSRIHKKIQKSMGPDYHAEVGLKTAITFDDYDLFIEGRADGIYYEVSDDGSYENILIDEIKGINADVMTLETPRVEHWAQAMCYAYMFIREYIAPGLTVQLTYVNLETEEIKRFSEKLDFAAVEDWFLALIRDYQRWSDYNYYHKLHRNESITPLAFPFEYRPGQDGLVKDVYRSINRKKTLFIQAPTGTGKTISTVYPAVMSMGQGLCEKIFYLTAKTATAGVAMDTFRLLSNNGYMGKTVALTAKDKVCPLEERACNPNDCERARGHYDRINDALFDIISNEDCIGREVIEEYAARHKVCPFELSLDVSLFVDNIICDYNYVFDPNVYLKRFFDSGKKSDMVFLVDEAHNMVDRAREMYSCTLVKEDFLYIKKVMSHYSKKLANACEKCNKILLEYKRKCTGNYLLVDELDLLWNYTLNIQSYFEALFAKKIKFGNDQDICLDFYFAIRDFNNLMVGVDSDHYRIYCEFDEEKHFCLHLFCIDPSECLQKRIDYARACVYFSATLLPINYYKSLLSEGEVYAIYADSVFDTKKRALLIANDVTSKYTRRSQSEYDKFADYIRKITEAKPGNYMVFGPSYKFIEEVYASFVFSEHRQGTASLPLVIIQKPGMSEEEREEFLGMFENDEAQNHMATPGADEAQNHIATPDAAATRVTASVQSNTASVQSDIASAQASTLIAFCTLGGIFSEGIDLIGDKLIGSIILGAGLPQMGNERNIMQAFFDDTGKNGFEYAYLYPGMNKVIQAAGRLIRTSDDVGVMALLDERFMQQSYKKCFPKEWDDYEKVGLNDISLKLTKFWSEID